MNINNNNYHPQDLLTEVVILGGGPSGLALAAQIFGLSAILARPMPKLVIHEAYETYQRKHVLQLDKEAFNQFPASEKLTAIINDFFGTKSTVNIPTSTIEETFKKYCIEQGAEFKYGYIDDPLSLKTRYPNAKIIVGADGTHSELRKQVITQDKNIYQDEIETLATLLDVDVKELTTLAENEKITIEQREIPNPENTQTLYKKISDRLPTTAPEELRRILLNRLSFEKKLGDQSLQYIVEMKYKLMSQETEALSFMDLYAGEKLINKFCREYIGKFRDGYTPVTIRTFLDRDTYEKIKDKATFKHPMTLDDPELPESLRKDFTTWLNLRSQPVLYKILRTKEIAKPEKAENQQEIKITATKLQTYTSPKVYRTIDGTTFAIVGDPTGAVPFFRQFNGIGLPGTSKLAKIVVDLLVAQDKTPSTTSSSLVTTSYTKMKSLWIKDPFEEYESFMQQTIKSEIRHANYKNLYLDSAKMLIAIGGLVPWQSNRFTADFIKKLENTSKSDKDDKGDKSDV